MISALFFPADLKADIAAIREQNDLNKEALSELRSYFVWNFLFWLSFVVMFSIMGPPFFYLIILISSPFLTKYFGKIHIRRRIVPYFSDDKRSLKLVKRRRYKRGVELVLEDDRGGRYTSPTLPELYRLRIARSRGESVPCYVSKADPERCMPDFNVFLEKYCLQFSKIAESTKVVEP